MLLNLLAASKFTFDGVNFFNNRITFTIFGKEVVIMYYAIAIVTGMIVCVLCAIPLMKKSGLNPDILLDLMIAIIPCSLVCARAWYVLNALEEYDTFLEMIDITKGGMAIYGGIAGGALGILITCKIKKIPFTKLADVGACLLPLGQAIGRWGNFFNQEVYGMPTTATFPFGVYISSEGEWRVALFFIESILNIVLFVCLYVWFLKAKPKRSGIIMSVYFIGYGLIRFILEPFRDPEFNLMVFGIRSQVLTSALVILAGVVILTILLYREYPQKFKSVFGKIKGLFVKDTENTDKNADNVSVFEKERVSEDVTPNLNCGENSELK